MSRSNSLLLLSGLACLLCGGCAGDPAEQAGDVADRFHAAVRAGDGAAACALLAAETVAELEQSTQQPCPQAVPEAKADVGAVHRAERYGNQAMVVYDADTVFLARFPDGWRIVAASCTHRDELPYDCTIKGP